METVQEILAAEPLRENSVKDGDGAQGDGERLRRAAEQGSGEAQFELGTLLYHQNNGETFEESLEWLRCAAGQGVVMAQMALATILPDIDECDGGGNGMECVFWGNPITYSEGKRSPIPIESDH